MQFSGLCPAAFRSGAVMGFLLAGLGLLNLFIAIILFNKVGVAASITSRPMHKPCAESTWH